MCLFRSRLEPQAELLTPAEVFRNAPSRLGIHGTLMKSFFSFSFLLSIGKEKKNENRRINPRPRSREFFFLLPKCDKIILSVRSNTSATTKAIFRFCILELARKQQTFGLKSSFKCSNYRAHTHYMLFFKTHFLGVGGVGQSIPLDGGQNVPLFPRTPAIEGLNCPGLQMEKQLEGERFNTGFQSVVKISHASSRGGWAKVWSCFTAE